MIDNPFEILGVSPTTTLAEARATFRRLAQMYHPDRYVDAPASVREEAERRMRELNGAFAMLVARRQKGAEPADLLREDPWLAGWWNSWERRRADDEHRAAKHRRWDDIERARIEREDRERASVETMWKSTYGSEDQEPAAEAPPLLTEARSGSLDARIRAAKRAQAEVTVTVRLDEDLPDEPVRLGKALPENEAPEPRERVAAGKPRGGGSGSKARTSSSNGATGAKKVATKRTTTTAKRARYKR